MSIASIAAGPPSSISRNIPMTLIVCDLHMPDRDGPALHRALARQPPPRPAIVFVTGYAHAGPYDEFLNTTQASVVSKPFTLSTLRERVRRVLSQS